MPTYLETVLIGLLVLSLLVHLVAMQILRGLIRELARDVVWMDEASQTKLTPCPYCGNVTYNEDAKRFAGVRGWCHRCGFVPGFRQYNADVVGMDGEIHKVKAVQVGTWMYHGGNEVVD